MGGTDSSAKPRASRRMRARGRICRVQERDIDILFALAKMRMLRTSDVSRLLFHARGTCQKRLRKLFDAGLVRTVVTDLARENRFVLTRLGHAMVSELRAEAGVPAYRAAPRVDGRSIAHLDLLNEYRIALALGAAKHGLSLRSFVPEWDLRAEDPAAKLIPDALCVLARRDGAEWQLAIEVDTGTEAPAVVERKLRKYELARSNGGVFGVSSPLVAIVMPKFRRAMTLARWITKSQIDASRLVFGAAPGVLVDGGLSTGLALPDELVQSEKGTEESAVFRRGLIVPA